MHRDDLARCKAENESYAPVWASDLLIQKRWLPPAHSTCYRERERTQLNDDMILLKEKSTSDSLVRLPPSVGRRVDEHRWIGAATLAERDSVGWVLLIPLFRHYRIIIESKINQVYVDKMMIHQIRTVHMQTHPLAHSSHLSRNKSLSAGKDFLLKRATKPLRAVSLALWQKLTENPNCKLVEVNLFKFETGGFSCRFCPLSPNRTLKRNAAYDFQWGSRKG